jgi:hypothetical protein
MTRLRSKILHTLGIVLLALVCFWIHDFWLAVLAIAVGIVLYLCGMTDGYILGQTRALEMIEKGVQGVALDINDMVEKLKSRERMGGTDSVGKDKDKA